MHGILSALVFFLSVTASIVQWRRRRHIRRSSSVGTGAMGAVYDLLNEDKRRAIEVLVEQKAAAVDPERARDKEPPAGPRER